MTPEDLAHELTKELFRRLITDGAMTVNACRKAESEFAAAIRTAENDALERAAEVVAGWAHAAALVRSLKHRETK